MEELQKRVKLLWWQMCDHDKIHPRSSFVVFSKDNPFAAAYYEAVTALQEMLKPKEKEEC